jgi:hypothetical protein
MSDTTKRDLEILEFNFLNKRADLVSARTAYRHAYAELLAGRRQYLTKKLSSDMRTEWDAVAYEEACDDQT